MIPKKGHYYKHKTEKDVIYINNVIGDKIEFTLIEDPTKFWQSRRDYKMDIKETRIFNITTAFDNIQTFELGKAYNTPLWKTLHGEPNV